MMERSKEHLDAFQHEVRMFLMGAKPYALITEKDPEGEGYIVRAKILHPPPPRLGIIVGDVVHNCRSALDMMVWEMAKSGTNPPPDNDTKTSFPICTDEGSWNGSKVAHLTDGQIEAVKALQPYKGAIPGDEPLAFLQALNNWAKHKALLLVGSLHISKITILSDHVVQSFKAGAFEDGDEILRIAHESSKPNPDEHFKADAMVHIGFAKEGPGRGWPAGELLDVIDQDVRQRVLPTLRNVYPE